MSDKKVINIRIEDDSDIYNKFDTKKETLSDELINYITNKMVMILPYEQIVIEIDTNEDVNVEKFKTCYENYINGKIREKEMEISFNNFRKVRLFVIGFVFILLSIVLNNNVNSIINRLLSIVGSFSIWEMTNLIVISNRDLKEEKVKLIGRRKVEIIKKENDLV